MEHPETIFHRELLYAQQMVKSKKRLTEKKRLNSIDITICTNIFPMNVINI